jgi:hypothetical protein
MAEGDEITEAERNEAVRRSLGFASANISADSESITNHDPLKMIEVQDKLEMRAVRRSRNRRGVIKGV